MTAMILAALGGLASALAYLWRRQWIDAALMLAATVALVGLVGQFPTYPDGKASVSINSDDATPVIGDAAVVRLEGDGLRESQWRDLPARTLQWKAPASDVLRLQFASQASPGRMFRLTATMPRAAPRRLQLLAENGQVIAEAAGESASLTVQWMPPVAETLLLKARLLDGAGKQVAEGPVPVQVRESVPLQVVGRFGSPSFDANALNAILAGSNAVLDWQVTLGKTVTRSEAPRAAVATTDLLVVDAARIETMAVPARTALLAEVAGGVTMLVLGGNAGDPGFWAKAMQLALKEQPETKPSGAPLALNSARYNPAAAAGPWAAAGDRTWIRQWEQGRIVWVGVSDWHRHAISEPRALGVWWQDLLDRAGVRRAEEISWLDPVEMPLPGQRLELCALGVKGEVSFPDLKQTLAWQRRPEKADASCVAVWPEKSGWLRMQSGAQSGQVYVYDKKDWPLWQRAQRRDATLRYAARAPSAVPLKTGTMTAWPFALAFALSMLLLWWRERR